MHDIIETERHTGINVIGYINGEFGIGEAVRLNIKALMEADVPVALINYDVKTAHRHEDDTFSFSEEFPYDVNLIQISPAEVGNFMSHRHAKKLFGKYNILYMAWESEYFPKEYVKNISYFDEIWVPSKFCQDVVSKVCEVPVITVPHPIGIELEPTDDPDALEFYDSQKYNFLFIFDYNSSATRKNIYGLIDAFERAFGKNNSEVALYIKTSLSKRFADEKAVLMDKISGFSNIQVVEKIFTKSALSSIINGCDCYVSLHRSEGFGLTLAEAMYFGKPVIGTGYSGNLEFMDFQNSFLVKYKMSAVGIDIHNYDKNTIWSEPDTKHAAKLLKFVKENPEEVSNIALRGFTDIREKLSFKKVGTLMKERLEFIAGKGHVDTTKNELLALEIKFLKIDKELKKIKKSNLISMILKIKKVFRETKSKIRKRLD